MSLAVLIKDIHAAAARIAGSAVRTPFWESLALSQAVGTRVFVKFEGAQHGGAFKFRGAFNRLSALTPDAQRRGVVAWSSGNHAQGIALAAKMLGMKATIVMPSDAPRIKLENTRSYGAEIVPYDRATESREEIATRIAEESGATLVPSFDDAHVIAGQGTVGLEIVAQSRALAADIGTVLVCCGGGGLVAGTSIAIKDSLPSVDIYAVEPKGFDDTARSLASGHRERIDPHATSICDALLAPSPGVLTFPINQALLAGGLTVSDEQVRGAMRFAFDNLKIVVEPGGAVALAAALAHKAPQRSGDMVVVVSGSNVDPAVFARVLKT